MSSLASCHPKGHPSYHAMYSLAPCLHLAFSRHYDVCRHNYNIATAYRCLGESELALEHANMSLNISQKSLPPNHPNIVWAIENIGYICEDMDKAIAVYRETLPSTHRYIADVKRSISILVKENT
jgi:tetratricopeptide (TPR) repeat protein